MYSLVVSVVFFSLPRCHFDCNIRATTNT